MYDDIEITTTTTKKIKNELSVGRIYEYEENIEVLITNSKPEREDR